MNDLAKVKHTISLREAEEFLWREADALDRADYQAWLGMWDEGGHYVIPIQPDATDFEGTLNIAYDDAKMRAMRVDRLQGGFAISATPAARTIRLVSRLVVEKAGADFVKVRSAMHLTEHKFDRQRVFVANVEHHLVAREGALKIRDKVVRIINADGVLTSISYLF